MAETLSSDIEAVPSIAIEVDLLIPIANTPSYKLAEQQGCSSTVEGGYTEERLAREHCTGHEAEQPH